MSNENLEGLVRGYFALELEDIPARHREQTDQCPSLLRFVEASREGWGAQEQEHISSCGYCQKTLAQQLRFTHPSVWQLFLHLLGRGANERAMEIHLEEDGCATCNHVLESPLLTRVKRLVEQGEENLELLEAWLRGVAVGAGKLSYTGAFAAEEATAFMLRAESSNKSLSATLRETVSNRLRLEVASPDPNHAGRKVIAELTPKEGNPTVITVTLEADEDGCFAVRDIGPFGDYARTLKNCCLLVYFDK